MAAEKTLVEAEKYLKSGVHIGTRYKSGEMRKYIYKMRKDSLNVMDIQTIDQRIKVAAKFLAKYPVEKIAIVSRRLYSVTPATLFAEITGAKAFVGRFIPGTFTNYMNSKFFEPEVVFVVEPEQDAQAIEEARTINVPVVALASTNNSLKNIDLAIPSNNKGRKSIALVLYLIAREFLKEKGTIKNDSEFGHSEEEFEYKMKENEREEDFSQDTKRRLKRRMR